MIKNKYWIKTNIHLIVYSRNELLNCILGLLVFILLLSCENHSKQELIKFGPRHELFKRSGRIDTLEDNSIGLIGSASSIEFNVSGDSIVLALQSQFAHGNNFALEINNEYQRRYMIKDSLIHKYTIHLPSKDANKVGVFKTSEAATGNLIFRGVEAKGLLEPPGQKMKTIEFIGNSITCGAQSDTSDVPCGEGFYHDQHNAYLAYGPRLARELNADYLLSAVSGIGIYRNWNDENELEPIMPQVYENLYLDLNSDKPYSFELKPDIVSICLGTNDMSAGDGIKVRKPFDKDKYIKNYVSFIDKIYKHYPDCQIILLNIPVSSAEKKQELFSCLKKVQGHFKGKNEIVLFDFDGIESMGCTGHPNPENQEKMAKQLLLVFKELISR